MGVRTGGAPVTHAGRVHTRGRFGRALAAVTTTLLLVGLASACSPQAGDPQPTRSNAEVEPGRTQSSPEPTTTSRVVLAISLDGLRPDAIEDLGPHGTPHLHRLMAEGASTLNARVAVERTITLPNHTSMLTGRPIDPALGGHGVSFNDDHPGTIHALGDAYVSSVFDVVHDAGGSTAFFTTKSKFDFLDRSWSEAGRRDRTGADDGRDKIDTYVRASATDVVDQVVDQVSGDPATFTFLHVGTLDDLGHRRGWGSRRYLRGVEQVDREVGRLLAAIDQRAEEPGRPEVVVVLTADHGGTGPGHLDATDPANYTVPFIVWGPGVPAGADLYELTDAYADPGDSRPSYDGDQPVRNGLVANLSAGLLELPAVPGSSITAHRSLVKALRDQ